MVPFLLFLVRGDRITSSKPQLKLTNCSLTPSLYLKNNAIQDRGRGASTVIKSRKEGSLLELQGSPIKQGKVGTKNLQYETVHLIFFYQDHFLAIGKFTSTC